MKCIDELKEIGIDKVSAKTRITIDKLQNIIEFKFDAFDKVRARGFVQIIEREFSVDLSEWFAAYNDYHSSAENVGEVSEVSDEVSKNINIPIDSDKKDKSYIVLIVLLVILVVLFVSFFIYNNFLGNTSQIKPKSILAPLQEIQKQGKTQSQIIANPSDKKENATDDSIQNNTQNIQEGRAIPNKEENTNATTQTIANPSENQASANPTAMQTTTVTTHIDELTITPNEPLWVGIIDLKTHRKKQLSIDSQHSLTLDGDKIIRTGHSYFSLSNGTSFNKQFIGGDNKYFVYRVDSGLREISRAEFLELNRGEEW